MKKKALYIEESKRLRDKKVLREFYFHNFSYDKLHFMATMATVKGDYLVVGHKFIN